MPTRGEGMTAAEAYDRMMGWAEGLLSNCDLARGPGALLTEGDTAQMDAAETQKWAAVYTALLTAENLGRVRA